MGGNFMYGLQLIFDSCQPNSEGLLTQSGLLFISICVMYQGKDNVVNSGLKRNAQQIEIGPTLFLFCFVKVTYQQQHNIFRERFKITLGGKYVKKSYTCCFSCGHGL